MQVVQTHRITNQMLKMILQLSLNHNLWLTLIFKQTSYTMMYHTPIKNLVQRLVFVPLLVFMIVDTPTQAQHSDIIDLKPGEIQLAPDKFYENLTGPNDHLGSLLYDTSGKLVIHETNKTWLYTGGLIDGNWISFVRELNLDDLSVSERKKVLTPIQGEKWSTIHLVIKLADDFYVAFYSTGKIVRVATTTAPQKPFTPVESFRLIPTQEWEQGCSLESDPGFVTIKENETELTLWMLYDSLCKGTKGHNGWAKIHIDKGTRAVKFLEKHPTNPIPLLLPGRYTARTGGNLDSSIRIDGKYMMIYLSKRGPTSYRLAVALSEDPLFQKIETNVELTEPLGEERVIEKFHWYVYKNYFYLFYEYATKENDWRTACRRYQIIKP